MIPGGMMPKDTGKCTQHLAIFQIEREKIKSVCATHYSSCQDDLANIKSICPQVANTLQATLSSTRE